MRVTLRQAKTGTLVKVRATQALRTELDAIAHNHATIVISESTGLPYREDSFRRQFRRIANLAGLDFQFRDLRRGGLTETGSAGATLVQLHATSGHKSLQSSQPYLIPTTEEADEAIRKREQARSSNNVKRNENSSGKEGWQQVAKASVAIRQAIDMCYKSDSALPHPTDW
jgi:hypothetical protein